ncbi:hypothetical protein [Amycolatopsis eburnea]|uniref:Uncharacterized protein n=1 Tax=Amycolatopsis eburnea TaxID=2267691 RepID=A0A427TG02_9PSEU|nr:hypothetical protein [Amycolatopsis eburnea]RSD22025.1 hypothetical protein EIY87_09425 [Amycolatopsis eburnea]
MPDTTASHLGETFAHAAARVLFVAAAVVVLTLAKTTEHGWAGPILIVAQIVLVALVRLSWRAHDRWAREYIAWLNSANVETWTTWHREYVAWCARQAARPAYSRPRTSLRTASSSARASSPLAATSHIASR